MEKLKNVTVEKLSIEAVQNLLSEEYHQLLLAEADIGDQAPMSFVVGYIQDVYDKITTKSPVKKRMVLIEVLADGTDGAQIDVIFYNMYAEILDDLLKKSKHSNKRQWLIFCNTEIAKYMGLNRSEWCHLSLRVGYGDNAPNVWLLTENSQSFTISNDDGQVAGPSCVPTSSIKKLDKLDPTYTTLNECKLGRKYNVFAAVSEIVKKPTETRNGNIHMLLGIADSSSPIETDGTMKDTLLQVFSNSKTSKVVDILERIGAGDIVRVRDMTVEIFNQDKRGKIYSGNQIVWFPGDVGSDIEPYTVCSTYVVSDYDKAMVKSLRVWAVENIQNRHLQNLANKQMVIVNGAGGNAADDNVGAPSSVQKGNVCDPLLVYMTISEITTELQFNLWCEIVEKRYVHTATEKMLILRVRDGTNTNLHFRQYDLEEATQDCLSQTDQYGSVFSEAVDVFVIQNVNMADDIEVGDTVCLKFVSCIKVDSDPQEEGLSFYELLMRNEGAVVQKAHRNHTQIRTIKKRLGRREEEKIISESTQSSQDSILNLVRNAYARTVGEQRLASPQRSQLSGFNENASPKLPSYTDSLENALKDISDLERQKSRTSIHSESRKSCSPIRGKQSPSRPSQKHSGVVEELTTSRIEFPLGLPSSTQLSPPPPSKAGNSANGLHHPLRLDATVSQVVKEDLPRSPNVSTKEDFLPAVISREDLQPAVSSKEDLQPAVSSKEDLQPSIHMPVVYTGTNESHSLTSLTPSPPSSKEVAVSEELSEQLPSPPIQVSTPHGKTSPEASNSTVKRKLLYTGEGQGATESPTKKLPRIIADPKSSKASTSATKGNVVITEKEKDTRKSAAKKVPRLTTDCNEEVVYTTLYDLISEGEEGVLYRVPAVVKQIFARSDHRCSTEECLKGRMCCHDWIWGLCQICGMNLSSWELRRKYSPEELSSTSLPCFDCSKNVVVPTPTSRTLRKRKTGDSSPAKSSKSKKLCLSSKAPVASTSKVGECSKTNSSATSKGMTSTNTSKSVVPFIHIVLMLEDPDDGSEILTTLAGDHAKQFLGVEPVFQWLTGKANEVVESMTHLIMQQRVPLWLGVKANNLGQYSLANTSLKVVYSKCK